MNYCSTEKAPRAIGPYSQAVKVAGMMFTSGQIPLDPATSKLVEGDFETMTRRVFENLKAVLESGGATFANVVKTTVFLKDFGDFQKMNAVYAEYFGDHKPARSTVEAARLPMDALIEIEMIAVV
ncbi:MAG: RidA family protein [Acidobacteriota bacterium]